MGDLKFSVILHGDPRLIDIVDMKWATQKLEFDDIEMNPEDKPKSADDELEEETEPDQDKWNETLQFFEECIS
jgi:hypothetical protein